MGGSGGGGSFFGGDRKPNQLREEVRQAIEETNRKLVQVAVAELVGRLLAAYNSRDYDAVAKRVAEIEAAASEEVEGTEELLFGGSVAKRTYVDGLSDIDSLLIINRDEVEGVEPKAVLEDLVTAIRDNLAPAGVKDIRAGTLAVTVEYHDGMEIQLLPATRYRSGFAIPDEDGINWRPIKPKEFARSLTKANQDLSNNLIPTIKLAKAMVASFPEQHRLSGYHIEALALRAFEGYDGEKSHAKLLKHFFEKASSIVLKPTRDVTGQSTFVDEDLGKAGSERRRAVSIALQRVARRMDNAQSVEEWQEILPTNDANNR